VSASLVSCAVGTDTGGSVRIPSSFCGLAGLKTTEGRLPLEGIQPLSHTLDTPGPMCRTVEDAAIIYLTMCGEEPGAINENFNNEAGLFGILGRGISGLTLGALTEADRAFLHPEVLESYVSVLERLGSLGAQIIEFDLPRSIDDMREGVATLIGSEGAITMAQLMRIRQTRWTPMSKPGS